MSDTSNEINSHVQITRSILKNFETTNKELYYLDFNSDEIKISNSKKLGTIKGYYCPFVEELLCKKIENKVGNIFKDISDFAENTKKEVLIKDINKVKKYVEYSIVRGKKYFENVKGKIDSKKNILDKWLHNLIIATYMENNILDDYKTTLFINKTNVKFITLSNTIYVLSENNIDWIVLPITPFVCIAFSKKCDNVINKKKINNDLLYECKHRDIIDSNLIEKMNRRALIMELCTSNEFLTGDNMELKKLRGYKKQIYGGKRNE